MSEFDTRVDRVEAILTAKGMKYETNRYWRTNDRDGACIRIPLRQFDPEEKDGIIDEIVKSVGEENWLSDEELVFYIPYEAEEVVE
jgi:SOS response regulatory protein OraA/RecX